MKRRIFLSLIPSITIILFSTLSFLALKQTNEYKLDSFASQLYDNKTYVYNDYDSVILKIKKNKPINENDKINNYQSLFSQYHYYSQVKDDRLLFDNQINDGVNDIQFYNQNTFSINNGLLPDGGHYIDYGVFSAYYADDILGPRKYLEQRFGCDSFIFISDNYADYLLDKYNISTYEELIKKEEYCVLNVNVDGERTAKFCINNILYSNKRHGGRAKELYNYFGLVYNSSKISSWSSFHLELDLKAYPYGTCNVLKGINELGYNKDNSTFSFFTYDKNASHYVENSIANEYFLSLFESNDQIWFSIFSIVILIDVACLIFEYFYLGKKFNISAYSLLFAVLFFVLYGIIINFILVNYLLSIVPVVSIILLLILQRKEVAYAFRIIFSKIFRKKIEEPAAKSYTIEI